MNAKTITLVSDLIRGLRHELGNLTTVLSLDLSLLEEARDERGLDRERLAELRQNVSDLGLLLTRLKEYPQPAAQFERIDLRHVVLDAVDHVSRQAPDSEIRCVDAFESADRAPIWVYGDTTALFRLIVNLLDNAVDANQRNHGPTITVTLTEAGREACLTIADDGPGFNDEVLYDPFSPAYTTKVTDGFMRGLGMGLFVAHAITSLHGGSITLTNQPLPPNTGASVTVALPLFAYAQQ